MSSNEDEILYYNINKGSVYSKEIKKDLNAINKDALVNFNSKSSKKIYGSDHSSPRNF